MSARRNVSASGREPFLTSEAACFAVDPATPFTLVQMSPILTPAWAAPPCQATNVTMGRADSCLMRSGLTLRNPVSASSFAVLFCGRSGQNLGLSGGDYPNPISSLRDDDGGGGDRGIPLLLG